MNNEIIGKIESDRLKTIAEFEEMLGDSYLGNLSNSQTSFLFDKFFKGGNESERVKRLRLLNISYSLPLMIAEKTADYVGSPKNIEYIDIHNSVMCYSWAGYAVFKVSKKDGKIVVKRHNADGYMLNDDGSEELLTYFVKEDENNTITKYIFKEVFTKGVCSNELYQVYSDSTTTTTSILSTKNVKNSVIGIKIPLGSIVETQDIAEVEDTELGFNPIVVVNNTNIDSEKYGYSDVAKIKSLISSIEVQIVNIQDQLLKHLQAKLALPTSSLPIDEKGFVDLSNLEVIGLEAGDQMPSYIINENKQIDKSFALVESMLKQVATILSFPFEFFGLEQKGGAETQDTKIIRISPFIKKVDRIRRNFKTGFLKINEIAKKWGVVLDDSIMWGPIFPINKTSEVVELSSALDSGLISQKRAIMRYQDLSEAEAEEEMNLINSNEQTVSGNI